MLAGCGLSRVPDASAGLDAPLVVRVEPREVVTPAEAVVLAHRILQRESAALLLDAGHRDALAREIEAVLARIRDADPSAAAVMVRPSHVHGRLILDLDPDLLETLSGLLDSATGPIALRTGQAEFDALNARLGLSTVTLYPPFGIAVFHIDEHVNIGAAIEAYPALAGVARAEPDVHLGDGPDIDASKIGGSWHVVVRKAWGDCPSGCLQQQLSFFSVTDTEVTRIEQVRAIGMVEFVALGEGRGWWR